MTIPRAYQSEPRKKTLQDILNQGKDGLLSEPLLKKHADQIQDIEDIKFKNGDFSKFLDSLSDDLKPVTLKHDDQLFISSEELGAKQKNMHSLVNQCELKPLRLNKKIRLLYVLIFMMCIVTIHKSYSLYQYCYENRDVSAVILKDDKTNEFLKNEKVSNESSVTAIIIKNYNGIKDAIVDFIPRFSFGKKAQAQTTADTKKTEELKASDKLSQALKTNTNVKNIPEVAFDPMSIDTAKEVETLTKVAAEKKALLIEKEAIKKTKLQLDVVKRELEVKVTELKALKESIQQSLLQVDKQHKLKLDKFIKIIDGMKIKNAAQIVEKLDPSVIKELLPQMNPKKISAILDQVSSAKAKEMLIMTVSEKNPYTKPVGKP